VSVPDNTGLEMLGAVMVLLVSVWESLVPTTEPVIPKSALGVTLKVVDNELETMGSTSAAGLIVPIVDKSEIGVVATIKSRVTGATR
jgi:hypothetical protein